MCGTAAAAWSRSTVTRTSSEPARASAATCRAVCSTSAVSVLVIDWTTIGAPPPTMTPPTFTNPQQLRQHNVSVNVGGVIVGGGAPIVVQSMTNTDTADVEQTARQVAALARAGSELVRVTVDRDQAAAAVPHIKERLGQLGVSVPIVGDFHYIGHKLLADHPACAEALDKYRINPGNVGFHNKRDLQFSQIV